MVGFGGASLGNLYFLFPFAIILFNLVLLGITLYFLITAIRFMKTKTRNDKELICKMDRLIQLYENENKNKLVDEIVKRDVEG